MSLYAYDVDGFLGDVGTARGWNDLAEALRRTAHTTLMSFAEQGYSEEPQALAATLHFARSVDPEIESMRANLAALAAEAEGILIVSDGVVEEEDVAKYTFNPNQPRDDHGRWTDDVFNVLPAGQMIRGERAFRTNEGYGRTGVSATINRKLRGGEDLNDFESEIARRLDHVISSNKLEVNLRTFHAGTIDRYTDDLVNKGYLSVSTSSDQAAAFKWRGQLSVIEVPRGTHFAVGDYHERELVLPRGGMFTRVGTTTDGLPVIRFMENPRLALKLDREKARRDKAHNDWMQEQYGDPEDIKKFESVGSRSLYVSRPVVNAEQIIVWAKAQGFETTLPPEDMHVTVAYSKAAVDWSQFSPNQGMGLDNGVLEIPAGERALMRLGDEGEAVVLRFDAPPLRARWQQFLDGGASWDYDGYHPHITLSYEVPKDFDLSKVPAYTGPIVLGPEKFEEVEEDWAEDVKEHAEQSSFYAAITTEEYAQRLKRTLDALEARAQRELHAVVEDSVSALIGKVKKAEDITALVKGLQLPYRSELEGVMRDMLVRARDAGARDGQAEIKSPLKEYASDFGIGYAPKSAMRWLRAKALWITGLLDRSILDTAKGILLNALKTGESLSATVEKLGEAFTPFVGGKVDEEIVMPYRLENIVRTNTTEAYNRGRLDEFLDPNLVKKGLIIGVRYLATIDERTTPVCNFLHGKVFKPDDPDLVSLAPGNHFQCRSIVSPVMVGQTVAPGDWVTAADVVKARSLADPKFLAEVQGPWRAYREKQDA